VFSVRYELNLYILFRRDSIFKKLRISGTIPPLPIHVYDWVLS
jgi:hypothetical protein